jgi:hypothetical protein
MARSLGVCIGILVSGLVATSAAGSPSAQTIPGRIVPGVGVGKLRLGMSEQAAKRVLAPLGSRKFVRRVNAGRPDEYIEYEYPHPNLRWDSFAAYTVGLRGRKGKRRVAVIEVHDARNRTREGIGVGSVESKLVRAYPNLRCVDFGAMEQTRTECRVGERTRRHTVFVVRYADVISGQPTRPRRITRVMLREPGVPLGRE